MTAEPDRRLTKAQQTALAWFRDAGPSKMFGPGDPSRIVIQRLLRQGLLDQRSPTTGFGLITYSINYAGLAALARSGGK